MLRGCIGIGALLGGGFTFKLSATKGIAFAIPLIKGLVVGAVIGFAIWIAFRFLLVMNF